MKKTILALAAFACLAAPSAAQETAQADDTRFRQLGMCIAYFAVVSGMDGKKEVPPALAARISSLASEMMFEATLLGYDDDTAHTSVVEKLVEMNTVVAEEGTGALVRANGQMCEAVAAQVEGAAR